MTEIEKLTTQIGELVNTDIPKVKEINYTNEKHELITTFQITMLDGNCYEIKLKDVVN
ncbi:MAG: hypothetical protein FWE22_03530 [Firmicutes bacterium]|nr:hypothetical protein [Bacillota bacterium]